jgi:hypothetical protein
MKGRRPPAAGMGRKPGVPNKITTDLKEMILGALNESGGQAYLVKQAAKNPVAFMALVARIIPTQIRGNIGLTVQAVRDMTPEQRQAHIDEILAEGRRYLEVTRLLEHKRETEGEADGKTPPK